MAEPRQEMRGAADRITKILKKQSGRAEARQRPFNPVMEQMRAVSDRFGAMRSPSYQEALLRQQQLSDAPLQQQLASDVNLMDVTQKMAEAGDKDARAVHEQAMLLTQGDSEKYNKLMQELESLPQEVHAGNAGTEVFKAASKLGLSLPEGYTYAGHGNLSRKQSLGGIGSSEYERNLDRYMHLNSKQQRTPQENRELELVESRLANLSRDPSRRAEQESGVQLEKQAGKEFDRLMQQASRGRQNIDRIRTLRAIDPETGRFEDWKANISSLISGLGLGSGELATDSQTAQSLLNTFQIGQLRGEGQVTEREREILAEIAAKLTDTKNAFNFKLSQAQTENELLDLRSRLINEATSKEGMRLSEAISEADEVIRNTPSFVRDADSLGGVMFFSDFMDAYQKANKNASINEVLESWGKYVDMVGQQ